MTVLLNDFINAVEEAGGEVYPNYGGRVFFKGHGGVFDTSASLVKLGAALQNHCPELVNVRPHMDDMGRGVIVAWGLENFAISEIEFEV